MDHISTCNINIKSKRGLSEDISLNLENGKVLRLEFISRLPEMEEWHKFRACNVTASEVENALQELQKSPGIDEAHVDKPRMKIKR